MKKILITVLVGDEENIKANMSVTKPNKEGTLAGVTIFHPTEEEFGEDFYKNNKEKIKKRIKKAFKTLKIKS